MAGSARTRFDPSPPNDTLLRITTHLSGRGPNFFARDKRELSRLRSGTSRKPRFEVSQRFGKIAPAVTEAHVVRFVVNRAGKKQDARLAYNGFTELANIPLRFEMGEANRAGVRRRPLEQIRVTREERFKQGEIPEDNLQAAIDVFPAMAKGQCGEELAGRTGADCCVVLERNDLLKERGVMRGEPSEAEPR